MNQIREPFAAIRCGFRPDGSELLYRPAPIGFALARTSGARIAATTGDGFGDAAGFGDAVDAVVASGEPVAAGDASVVAAAVGDAELAVAASTGTCADSTLPPFATVKKLVASSYNRSPPATAMLTLPSARPSALIFTTRPCPATWSDTR